MSSEGHTHRYKMVDIRPGYVVMERDQMSRAMRAWFSTEPIPPKESYREGTHIWKHAGTAQSFQFDVHDSGSGETVRFPELLGLLYWACIDRDSTLYRIGELAHENRISIYIAITYEAPDGTPSRLSREKVTVLNHLFNDRLQASRKKILILPDLFDLYRTMSYGQMMIDFGLTSMEAGR